MPPPPIPTIDGSEVAQRRVNILKLQNAQNLTTHQYNSTKVKSHYFVYHFIVVFERGRDVVVAVVGDVAE